MSIEKLPTVTIKTKNGPVEINMTDYKEGEHEFATAEEIAAAAPAPSPVVEAPAETVTGGNDTTIVEPAVIVADPATYAVGKNGKRGAASKFIIKNAEGNQVGEDEYDSEEDAQAAIELLVEQHAAAA